MSKFTHLRGGALAHEAHYKYKATRMSHDDLIVWKSRVLNNLRLYARDFYLHMGALPFDHSHHLRYYRIGTKAYRYWWQHFWEDKKLRAIYEAQGIDYKYPIIDNLIALKD